jgi:hypothetical protein
MRFRYLCIALASVLLAIFGCAGEVQSTNYSTLAEAADSIDRGWIPAVLPESTADLYETHNLDTNVGYGTFSFGAVGTSEFKSALMPIRPGQPDRSGEREALEADGYSFYTHEDFVLAVNWSEQEGRFWLGPGK